MRISYVRPTYTRDRHINAQSSTQTGFNARWNGWSRLQLIVLESEIILPDALPGNGVEDPKGASFALLVLICGLCVGHAHEPSLEFLVESPTSLHQFIRGKQLRFFSRHAVKDVEERLLLKLGENRRMSATHLLRISRRNGEFEIIFRSRIVPRQRKRLIQTVGRVQVQTKHG